MKKLERQMLTALAVSWMAAGGSALAQTDWSRGATPKGSQTAQGLESRAIAAAPAGAFVYFPQSFIGMVWQ